MICARSCSFLVVPLKLNTPVRLDMVMSALMSITSHPVGELSMICFLLQIKRMMLYLFYFILNIFIFKNI